MTAKGEDHGDEMKVKNCGEKKCGEKCALKSFGPAFWRALERLWGGD
jgi:hypothetical protein